MTFTWGEATHWWHRRLDLPGIKRVRLVGLTDTTGIYGVPNAFVWPGEHHVARSCQNGTEASASPHLGVQPCSLVSLRPPCTGSTAAP